MRALGQRGAQIVSKRGYGFADAEKKALIDANTRFELASVTKQITAMAARILVTESW